MNGTQDPEIRDAAESALAHFNEPMPASGPIFSPRERAVLAELRKGGRNREIADRFGVTEEGVRHHLKNIYRKWARPTETRSFGGATSIGVR